MTTLVDKLTKETESFKEQYLEMTKDWAVKHVEYLNKQKDEYYSFFDQFPERTYFRDLSRSDQDRYYKLERLIGTTPWSDFTISGFMPKALKKAEAHFKNSLIKLADRITKKGLDEDNLTIESAHVGVNFDCRITDGEKTVRAWTIIAEGAIIRPHYRYLVK